MITLILAVGALVLAMVGSGLLDELSDDLVAADDGVGRDMLTMEAIALSVF